MAEKDLDFKFLRKKTEELRYNLVAMMDYAGSGHPGGSLSSVEILSVLYYGGVLKKLDPKILRILKETVL